MSSEEENNVSEIAQQPEIYDPEDTIKILLATDCHLGYERSTKRDQENDSLVTFEEILQLAVEHEVDFILLGGDLFHDTKPPQDVVSKCIELLRKYCMGTREVKIQLLTDPNIIFQNCEQKTVNFEDPNLNISIPVFSINGNHDDPSTGAMGALDLLSSTGFVNYFGKWTDLSKIEIPPLILKKGNTYISLYGLSYINDKRLARIIRDSKFKMLRAQEIPESFNMFVLHQNRSRHSNLTYVPDDQLPEFLNFIMWGHEHECRINPEYYDNPGYWICQPGSSVATSLSEGEAVPKHVGLLSVHKTTFKLKPLKLQTVRPFVLGNVSVDKLEGYSRMTKERVPLKLFESVKNYIDQDVMDRLVELATGHPKQPAKPLLRIKVHVWKEEEKFETMKLCQYFSDTFANPIDMILFIRNVRKSVNTGTASEEMDELMKLFSCEDVDDETQWNKTVQEGISKYFIKPENVDKLTILSVAGLNEALSLFTDREDKDAFENLVTNELNKTVEHLTSLDFAFKDDHEIKIKIKEYKNEQLLQDGDEDVIRQLRLTSIRREKENGNEELSGDGEQVSTPAGRGKGRGRGKARGRGRAKANPIFDSNDDEEDQEEIQPQTQTRGRGGRGRSRATTTRAKRGRGRSAKQLDNTLDVHIIPKSSATSSASSKDQSGGSKFFQLAASQSHARDDEFFDSD